MREYIFHLKVVGHGDSKEDAWEVVKAQFALSDVVPEEVEILDVGGDGEIKDADVIGWDEDEPESPAWLRKVLDEEEGD